jgi:hypothetical protein
VQLPSDDCSGFTQVTSLTPEHGPPPYQPCAPDGTPLADIDEVNVWLGERQRRRFHHLTG